MAPGRAVQHGAAVRCCRLAVRAPCGAVAQNLGDTLIAPGPQSSGL